MNIEQINPLILGIIFQTILAGFVIGMAIYMIKHS